MKAPFLMGKDIFLSNLTAKINFDQYASWLNDQETTLFMASGRFPVTPAGLKRYVNEHLKSHDGMLLGIFLSKSKKHVGNITLHQIDYRNRIAEIGIILGESNLRGRGYGTEAIKLVANHAFTRLNLNKLCSGIVRDNIGSVKAFRKAGFQIEGVLRQQFYLNGKYLTMFRLGLLRKDFV